MTGHLAGLALAVVLALTAVGPGSSDDHRARCHGEPRPPRLGLMGGPWTCVPSRGWTWPLPAWPPR